MSKKNKIYLVAAVDAQNGIGKDGTIPWNLKKELKYFFKLTTGTDDKTKQNMLIMGRLTWESLPEKNRPLVNRKNIVLSRNKKYQAKGATVVSSLDQALKLAGKAIENIFIIGGAELFQEAILRRDMNGIYLTRIRHDYQCDVFFPKIPKMYEVVHRRSDLENNIYLEYFFYQSKIKL
ncbi:dihydrofolate reductase [Patescibacteria group bacterium]|nr:dihydrofolate reductase [Patescibacteria group bacterium]